MTDASPRYFHGADGAEFFDDHMGKADVFESPRVFCGMNTFEPGQSHEPHTHDQADKLYVVLRGRGSVTIGGARRILATGDVAVAPAGVEHGILADGGERFVVLVVLCPAPGAAEAPPPAEAPVAEPVPEPIPEPAPVPVAEPDALPQFGPPPEPDPEPVPVPAPEHVPAPTLEPVPAPTLEPRPAPTLEPPPAPKSEPVAEPAGTSTNVPLPDIFGKLKKIQATSSPQPTKAPEIEPTPTVRSEPSKAPAVQPAPEAPSRPTPRPTDHSESMALPDIFRKLTPAGMAPTIVTPPSSPISPVTPPPSPATTPLIQPGSHLGGSKEDIPGSAIDGTFLGVHGDHLEFRADDLSDPILVLPTPGEASRYGPGPARVVLEASARRFNRTMGTARAVQILDGKPVRFTGLVLKVEPQRSLVLIDVGYPVVVRDLSGQAAASLTPGSGVMIPAEGSTRAIVLSS